jgi:Uma2 family endonuclease
VLARNADTVRAPDLAFVRADRIPPTGVPFGFWPGAPDLAGEILSPDDSPPGVRTRVRDYLRRGVPLVWVIDPRAQRVEVHRPSAVFQTIAAGRRARRRRHPAGIHVPAASSVCAALRKACARSRFESRDIRS